MTYYLTILTNDKARLIVSETRTTDAAVADLVREHYKAAGYIVVERVEN